MVMTLARAMVMVMALALALAMAMAMAMVRAMARALALDKTNVPYLNGEAPARYLRLPDWSRGSNWGIGGLTPAGNTFHSHRIRKGSSFGRTVGFACAFVTARYKKKAHGRQESYRTG